MSDYLRMQIHMKIQNYMIHIHKKVLDEPYRQIGKDHCIYDDKPKYKIIMPGSFKTHKRKPIEKIFQEYCEDVYFPIICTLYFGISGWNTIQNHFFAYTISTMLQQDLIPGAYHMHLDSKIGSSKDKYCNRVTRILTSYMHSAIENPEKTHLYGASVYPIEQHNKPFLKMSEYHAYMNKRYEEKGKCIGRDRPLYEIHEVQRLLSGQVAVHPSHTENGRSQPIHSEPNPDPEGGRYCICWDFKNIRVVGLNRSETMIDIPEMEILEYMTPLTNDDEYMCDRLLEVEDILIQCTQIAKDKYGITL
jgi:hypothetical protein